MDIVAAFVIEHLGDTDPYATVVLDESGQQSKATTPRGSNANTWAAPAGSPTRSTSSTHLRHQPRHALVAARPYLPKERVPPGAEFKTKPALAVDMLTTLRAAGLCPPWTTGDEVYGRDPTLRVVCEDHHIGYALGVPRSFRIMLGSRRKVRADQALKLLQRKEWNRASCGAGSKGDRTYTWAWIGTASPHHHLLIRRSLHDPTDLAFFYCYVPADRPATLHTLVTIAGRRWPVEEDFQIGKDQFGLDHSQVRKYIALLRHLVLAVMALAIHAVTAAAMRHTTATLPRPPTSPDDEPPEDPGLIALTVAEVKRLTNLITRGGDQIEHHLRWAWWRRRHQARARWFHQRTRLRHSW